MTVSECWAWAGWPAPSRMLPLSVSSLFQEGGWKCELLLPAQPSLLVLISEEKAPAPFPKQQQAPLVSSLLPAGASVPSAASCWLLLLLLGPPADWEESAPVG